MIISYLLVLFKNWKITIRHRVPTSQVCGHGQFQKSSQELLSNINLKYKLTYISIQECHKMSYFRSLPPP